MASLPRMSRSPICPEEAVVLASQPRHLLPCCCRDSPTSAIRGLAMAAPITAAGTICRSTGEQGHVVLDASVLRVRARVVAGQSSRTEKSPPRRKGHRGMGRSGDAERKVQIDRDRMVARDREGGSKENSKPGELACFNLLMHSTLRSEGRS